MGGPTLFFLFLEISLEHRTVEKLKKKNEYFGCTVSVKYVVRDS